MLGMLKNIFGANDSAKLEEIVKQGAYLVDVRSAGEFASGHVKGSVNIPVDQIKTKAGMLKSKAHVIVFCRSGARSSQAKAILEQAGLNNVINGGTWTQVNQIVTKS